MKCRACRLQPVPNLTPYLLFLLLIPPPSNSATPGILSTSYSWSSKYTDTPYNLMQLTPHHNPTLQFPEEEPLPLFLYPASSRVPISSIRHRLAPSHLHPIWRPQACLLCRGDLFQTSLKKLLPPAYDRARMVSQLLGFELAQTCAPHTPSCCQGEEEEKINWSSFKYLI